MNQTWESIAPEWIGTLPRDRRGYPVAAEAAWVNGSPLLSINDPARAVILVVNRRCAVCGYAMPPGTVGYRAFSQGDAARIRMGERDQSQDWSGPAHRSCMFFSAIACPFLKDNTGQLASASKINPRGRRGTLAAVFGFRDFGLLAPANAGLYDPDTPAMFSYYDLIEDHRYRNGEELVEILAQASIDDAPTIFDGSDRTYWAGDEAASKRLVQDGTSTYERLLERGPRTPNIHVAPGRGRYLEYSV